MPELESWGTRLRNVRKRLGLTQTEMRQIIGMGAAIDSWESGDTAMDKTAHVQIITLEGVADAMPHIISGLCARLAEKDEKHG